MERYEKLNVYIRYEDGAVACICMRKNKLCGNHCEKEQVSRYKFYGWKATFYQNKYGKSKL